MDTIASVDQKSTGVLAATLLAPLRATGRFMIALAEANPRMRALASLGHLSDAELAAKGLTREGEIRRILGTTAF